MRANLNLKTRAKKNTLMMTLCNPVSRGAESWWCCSDSDSDSDSGLLVGSDSDSDSDSDSGSDVTLPTLDQTVNRYT